MDLLGAVLLVLGYAAALPVIVRIRAVLAERRRHWFAVLMAGMAAIVVGYLLGNRALPAAINAAGAAGLALGWWRSGKRERGP